MPKKKSIYTLSKMSVIVDLIKEFLKEEYFKTGAIFSISLLNNILQTVGFSRITAQILSALQAKDYAKAQLMFQYFVYLSLIYVGISYVYRYFQNGLLSKLYQWSRYQLVRMLLVSNDENFSNENFTSMIAPVNRASSTTFSVLNDLITFYIPNMIFLLVSIGYILYQDVRIGIVFVLGNLLWMAFLYYNWKPLVKKNKEYEDQVTHTEKYLTEMMNNVDKIITRGQTNNELTILKDKKDLSSTKAFDFYSFLDNNLLVVNTIVLVTVLICIGIGINLYKDNKYEHIAFVTFFTILLMYRDRVLNSLNVLPEFIETFGRSETLLKNFKNLKQDYENQKNKIYKQQDLTFDDLVLDNVCFEYKDKAIFKDMNLHLQTTNNKIIGLTGQSGKGKSTMCKMFLKMYKCNKGAIYIDGVDIEDVDPLYLRSNITYINQNSKLFDMKVLENMLYGCNDEGYCREKYEYIMNYPKIQELYDGVDLENGSCGALGEKLSGGQRQVVNIISGLINPCKILILDEPTNALDKELKTELLEIIKSFKQTKQSMIIITHDKDVYPLFDDHIEI